MVGVSEEGMVQAMERSLGQESKGRGRCRVKNRLDRPCCGGSPVPDEKDIQIEVKMTGDGLPFLRPPLIVL